MGENPESKNWLQTLPGLLTALAGLIGAITALIVALSGNNKAEDVSAKGVSDGCMSPYVWRLAVPSDHVCVTPDRQKQVELENQRAAERREASGGSYGADTCKIGYVWREAFEGDSVCVTPDSREQAKNENADATQRMQR